MTFDRLKNFVVSGLNEFIETGEVDYEMITWLHRFNEIPCVLTVESCHGHDEEDKPYIYLIVDKDEELSLGNDIHYHQSVCTPIGEFGQVHMYGFHFNQKTWKEEIEKVLNNCKGL